MLLIISSAGATSSHASIMMLPLIRRCKIWMIAHSTYVTSATLQHIHSSSWLHCSRSTMSTAMSAIWYALIFNSNVRDFRKKPWLITRVELVFVVCYVQICGAYSVYSNILIFHRWNMSLSILSTIICIICQSSISSKLISLSSNLTRNTMILLSIVILMLMWWISGCLLTLALWLSSLLVYLKFF